MSNVVWISSGSDLRQAKARRASRWGAGVMAELDFEMKLDRMFHEPPPLPDAATFATLLEMRLSRSLSLRQFGIGAALLVAGLIGMFQLMNTGILVDACEATERQAVLLT